MYIFICASVLSSFFCGASRSCLVLNVDYPTYVRIL